MQTELAQRVALKIEAEFRELTADCLLKGVEQERGWWKVTLKKGQVCHFRPSRCHFYLHFKKKWWNNEAWVLRAERERETEKESWRVKRKRGLIINKWGAAGRAGMNAKVRVTFTPVPPGSQSCKGTTWNQISGSGVLGFAAAGRWCATWLCPPVSHPLRQHAHTNTHASAHIKDQRWSNRGHLSYTIHLLPVLFIRDRLLHTSLHTNSTLQTSKNSCLRRTPKRPSLN